LVQIETALVDQHRQARGGEGLGDRADRELRPGRHRQSGFHVALAIGFEERGFAIVDDGDRKARYLPLRHRLGGEGVQLRRDRRDCRFLHLTRSPGLCDTSCSLIA
jgi:hypothetical protein